LFDSTDTIVVENHTQLNVQSSKQSQELCVVLYTESLCTAIVKSNLVKVVISKKYM